MVGVNYCWFGDLPAVVLAFVVAAAVDPAVVVAVVLAAAVLVDGGG